MDAPLRPELEKYVEEQVSSGKYPSAIAVLEDALTRMMDDPLLDEASNAAIDEAEDQIEQGRHLDWKVVSVELRKKYLDQ